MSNTFRSENKTINKLLDNGTITEEEYTLLFEDKPEYSDNQSNQFHIILKKVILLQEDLDTLDLSYIRFIDANFEKITFSTDISFSGATFVGKTNFDYATFSGNTDFSELLFSTFVSFHEVNFSADTDFSMTIFLKGADFSDVIFFGDANFVVVTFHGEAYFGSVTFDKNINFYHAKFFGSSEFENCKFQGYSSFLGTSFSYLNLESSSFSKTNFLHIQGYDSQNKIESIKTSHFANKESARIIKDDFESKRNISETNKYFALEQELYLEELKRDGWWKNKNSIFTVGLHGFISNYGTSWIKVLISIFIFIMLVFLGYEYLHDFVTIKEGFYPSLNKTIELIDPLKMFKIDDKTYEGHSALGFGIRLITIYLFYQFITAFRNNTRRK